MRIQFWHPLPESKAPTWLVNIGDHWFEMDSRALQPNGVNVYAGDDIDRSWISGHMEMIDQQNLIPREILWATLLRIADSF